MKINVFVTFFVSSIAMSRSARLLLLLAASAAVATATGSATDNEALTAPLTVDEREAMTSDFVDIVQVDSESSDKGGGRVPSTDGQRTLAVMLRDVLPWPRVEVDELGCMHGVISGRDGAPAVAMLAHVDTSPQFTGAGVRPLVHRDWDGSPIMLPHGDRPILDPRQMPALQRVAGLNDTIITSSGDTLLGADDKSGVALLLAVARRLLSLPQEQRGATVEFVFNTDEEIGLLSAQKLKFLTEGVVASYTFDGETFAQVDTETWHAEGCQLFVTGVSVHPGYSFGTMVNAAALAANFISEIHNGAEADPTAVGTPRTTGGPGSERSGFVHVLSVHGDVGSATVPFILRDFSVSGVAARRAFVDEALSRVRANAPRGASFNMSCSTTYQNMKSVLDRSPLVVEHAVEAVKRATGVSSVGLGAIRGGTDGSVLTLRGKPTPNIFAGWHEAHGPKEWASATEMVLAAQTALHLIALWGQQEARTHATQSAAEL